MPHAFLLELIPFAQEASPLHFSLHAHGLFFALLGNIDPQKATEIHQAKRKPFTLTPLSDKHTLRLRITTLDDALFAPFLGALLEEAPRGLSLGDHPYTLTRVLATPQGHRLAGRASWEELAQAPPAQSLTLHFLTLTVFTTSKPGGRVRYLPLPEPRLILNSLLRAWQAYSPFAYSEEEAATNH
jgi:CRISPR-associated endoribonuclease Cas6